MNNIWQAHDQNTMFPVVCTGPKWPCSGT